MNQNSQEESLQTLSDIKRIMERSARFLSLSGWSGIWAGIVGLISAAIAYSWIADLTTADYYNYRATKGASIRAGQLTGIDVQFIALAAITFIVALAGGIYFTWNKTKKQGLKIWNSASKKMLVQIAIPLCAGGVFVLVFLFNGLEMYIAPTSLTFYGLALLNGSKYTLSDIQYLGILEVLLGCISLLVLGHGLIFWAIGFGLLHIIYGVIMWNKYDKKQ
ncbi:MAG: hypothetical protein R2800_01295 [Flavipsychrobacter sp.]